ncbi:hypothetical protein [Actinokineospora globicatena]|nr:hypothetical protein [Actinokineospora globicatena]MCP2305505.1 hypothetical protein [Actinokineospora globicatena]GLW81372.1 hypothetical protein Aglo01_58530 [Actinokineospora globicatena]GLW87930.1 hypothetical protein Aglo02_55690 [Actinokineospora globicatena]
MSTPAIAPQQAPVYPPLAQAPVLEAFGGGGFGPAGSGLYPTGSTPVPVRAVEPDGLPTVKDQVRKRPAYLVEGDDDEMFGNDEFTAPPVIGE